MLRRAAIIAVAAVLAAGLALPLHAEVNRRLVQFDAADSLLRAGQWAEARRALQVLDARVAADPGPRGEWLARLALIEAAEGDGERAAWHWAVANSFAAQPFTAAELQGFGGAGATLAALPLRRPGEASPGVNLAAPAADLEPAVRLSGTMPQAPGTPWAPRASERLEVVIGEDGHLHDPLVLSARDPEMAYRTLEAMFDWRFQPARRQGRPVAILKTLEIDPPGHVPLANLMHIGGASAAIEALLRRQQWSQAKLAARDRWYALLASTAPEEGPGVERAALGLALGLRALADTAAVADSREPGKATEARCRWEAAESLWPALNDLDLTPYGPAGETVSAWRQESFTRPFYRQPELLRTGAARAVEKPEKRSAAAPYYPLAARKQNLEGRVVISSIIDANGQIQDPRLVPADGGSEPARDAAEKARHDFAESLFAASALDTVCRWQFKPATLGGRPVKVYYSLTVNFAR